MSYKKVGVIGAGTMGQGIAEMLAIRGLDVYLAEVTPEKLEQAWDMIVLSLDKQIEKWAITIAEKKLILSKIRKVRELREVEECDLIIETITEDIDAKKAVFRQLDQVCGPDAVLASNTSTLSITELANETSRPERVLGMHFLYPVNKIDLVEVIRGLKTNDETYEKSRNFVEVVLRKKAVQVYESPGFVTTRLATLLINEAMHVLNEGVASAEDIDSAMRIGYDFHFGPLEMADRFGLDSVLYALERMFREFGDVKYRPSFLLKKMVRAGQLGAKTGEGFFRYDKEGNRIR